jgi:transcriptional regulator with XRE-family HTH domain
MSQEALAHLAGCSKNHIQVIEAAGRAGHARVINLRLTTLYGLAEALGLTPWALIESASEAN